MKRVPHGTADITISDADSPRTKSANLLRLTVIYLNKNKNLYIFFRTPINCFNTVRHYTPLSSRRRATLPNGFSNWPISADGSESRHYSGQGTGPLSRERSTTNNNLKPSRSFREIRSHVVRDKLRTCDKLIFLIV